MSKYSIRKLVTSKWPDLLVAFSILTFLVLALFHVNYPGLYYDEAIFVNAALGAQQSDNFVSARMFGIPMMIFPYIGALKSIIYAPIFFFFGVNILSIRLPVILFSCLSLLLIYLILRSVAPKPVSALVVLALSVDAPFILHSRVDHGPIVLMVLIKLAAIYCLLRGVQTQSWKLCVGSLILLLLGIWDKLNFVWVLMGFAPAVFIYWRRIKRIVQAHLIPSSISFVCFIATLIYFYYSLIQPVIQAQKHNFTDLFGRFISVAPLYESAANCNSFCMIAFKNFNYHEPTISLWLVAFVYLSITVLFSIAPPYLRVRALRSFSAASFFMILSIVLFCAIGLTAEARGPHHFLVLWPFPYIVCALSLTTLLGLLNRTSAKRISILLLVCLIAFTANRAFAAITIIKALIDQPLRPQWSHKISDLTAILDSKLASFSSITFIDWGLGVPVIALSKSKIKYKYLDLCYAFAKPLSSEERNKYLNPTFSHGRLLAVLYPASEEMIPGSHRNFLQYLEKEHLNCSCYSVIEDKRQIVYEIYCIEPIKAGDD